MGATEGRTGVSPRPYDLNAISLLYPARHTKPLPGYMDHGSPDLAETQQPTARVHTLIQAPLTSMLARYPASRASGCLDLHVLMLLRGMQFSVYTAAIVLNGHCAPLFRRDVRGWIRLGVKDHTQFRIVRVYSEPTKQGDTDGDPQRPGKGISHTRVGRVGGRGGERHR